MYIYILILKNLWILLKNKLFIYKYLLVFKLLFKFLILIRKNYLIKIFVIISQFFNKNII